MAIRLTRNGNKSVTTQQRRTGKCGISTEAEHRRIASQALRKTKTFAQLLTNIPRVGKDADFKRIED